MLRVIEVGLIQCAALTLINCAGIAVTERLKFRRIEAADLAAPAVELHRDPRAVDLGHGSCDAVVEPKLLVRSGELNAIMGGEGLPPVGGRQRVIRAKLAALPPHRAEIG